MRYLLLLLLTLTACSTLTTRDKVNLSLDGEGKSRLELGEEQYVVSFESAFDPEKKSWALALYPPMQPEIVIEFSDLDRAVFNPQKNARALRELENLVSQKRPELRGMGRKLGEHFHYYLRWVYAKPLALEGKQPLVGKWEKEIFSADQKLGQGFLTRLSFKRPTETSFKQATFEIVDMSGQVKFRLEFFF